LEHSCLPTAVGLTEGGGEGKEGKESRTGGGGENKEKRRFLIVRTCTDLKDTW